MPRESPAYRDTLEDILAFSGGRRMLSVGEVSKYTGLVDYRTLHRHFPFTNGYISAILLARALCKGAGT